MRSRLFSNHTLTPIYKRIVLYSHLNWWYVNNYKTYAFFIYCDKHIPTDIKSKKESPSNTPFFDYLLALLQYFLLVANFATTMK